MNIFATYNVNGGRQPELDWARGLAVFFMVCIHVAEEMTGIPPGVAAYIINFTGGALAAPVFMFLLGAGLVYSKDKSPGRLARRGCLLFALHYGLNLAAFGIPVLIRDAGAWDGVTVTDFWNYVLEVDILAFAGLVFLLFALKEKLGLGTSHLILFTLLMSCLNFLLIYPIDDVWLAAVAGLFVHVGEYSFFPFCVWIAYPVMGYIFGGFLIRCRDKGHFYRYLFIVAALVVAAMTLASRHYGFSLWKEYFVATSDFYFRDFLQDIMAGGIICAWISMLYAVSRLPLPAVLTRPVFRLSRNITVIYCCQWLIIGWLTFLTPFSPPPVAYVIFGLGILITALSDVAALLYKKYSVKRT